MNVSDKAQDAVVRVRNLLERFTVPCHICADTYYDGPGDWCGSCHGARHIPDPAYARLRELVEEPCEGFRPRPHSALCACHGTQKLTHDWTHSLSCSLWGAAMERLPQGWEMSYDLTALGVKEYGDFNPWYKLEGHDRDLAIMTALEAALTAQLEAANAHA